MCCCEPILGQTDTVPFHRPCSAYYADSARKQRIFKTSDARWRATVRPIVTDVQWSVCLLDTIGSLAEMAAEQTEVQFGMWIGTWAPSEVNYVGGGGPVQIPHGKGQFGAHLPAH